MAKSSAIGAIATAAGIIAVAVIVLVIFNRIGGSDLFSTKREEERKKTLEEREDAGIFEKIQRFLFGQDIGTPDEVGKNDVDSNTKRQEDEAKRQQREFDAKIKQLKKDTEKEAKKVDEQDKRAQALKDELRKSQTISSGAFFGGQKFATLTQAKIAKAFTAPKITTRTTTVGGTKIIKGSPALIARIEKNKLR